MELFITGDRSLPAPFAVGPVMSIMLENLFAAQRADEKLQIVTGDNDGVEAAVRYLVGELDEEIAIVATPRDAEGKRDWAARADALKQRGVKVIALHGAPEQSNMLKPMLGTEWDERFELVGS